LLVSIDTFGRFRFKQLCPTRGPVEGFVQRGLGFRSSKSTLHIDNLSIFW